MDFGMNLGQSQRLEQTLTPQLLQSVTILQKNALELETAIKEEVENNPLLELDESLPENMVSESGEGREGGAGDDLRELGRGENDNYADDVSGNGLADDVGGSGMQEMDFSSGSLEDSADMDYGILDGSTPSELDWAKYLEDGTSDTDAPFKDLNREEKDQDDVWDRPQKDREKSLQEKLLDQLREWNGTRELLSQLKTAGCSEEKFRQLVEYLINSLDENGYLQGADDSAMMKVLLDNDPLIVMAEKVLRGEVPLESASLPVAEAIHVLQSFSPRGIGARNLQECFLIQARYVADFPELGLQILQQHFEDLMALRYPKIAKELGVPLTEVQQAVACFSKLVPHPGRQISSAPAGVKVADMRVVEKKGRFEVECFKKQVQRRLRINKEYASLLDSPSASKADKEYIRTHLVKAQEFIKAIDNRFTTMEKVMQAIVKRQKEFFKKGPAFLKPMILQEIADEVGRDLSTISRVTNGKFVDTPYGIFELKQFFTSGVKQGSAADDEVVGSAQILASIKKLVDEEDKKKPLSDQAIADALEAQGIKVARRTVAKYREEELKILPARARKAIG